MGKMRPSMGQTSLPVPMWPCWPVTSTSHRTLLCTMSSFSCLVGLAYCISKILKTNHTLTEAAIIGSTLKMFSNISSDAQVTPLSALIDYWQYLDQRFFVFSIQGQTGAMRRWRMEAVHSCVCQLHRLINTPLNTLVCVHKVRYSLQMDCVADQVSNSLCINHLTFYCWESLFFHNALFISILLLFHNCFLVCFCKPEMFSWSLLAWIQN